MATVTDPDEVAIKRLIKRLGSPWLRTRKLAEEALVERGPEVVAPLLAAWRPVLPRRKITGIAYGVAAILPMFVFKILWAGYERILGSQPDHASFLASQRYFHHVYEPGVAVTATACYSIVIIAGVMFMAAEQRRQRIASVAAKLHSKQFANILVNGAFGRRFGAASQMQSQGDAQAGLTQVLTDLEPSDANVLTPASRGRLLKWLMKNATVSYIPSDDLKLASAILTGMSTIGSAELRPFAERLSRPKEPTPNQTWIRDEALLALGRLDEWDARGRSGAVLLRGSESPATSSDVLVRPAGAATESGDELLRPGSSVAAPVRTVLSIEEPEVAVNTAGS